MAKEVFEGEKVFFISEDKEDTEAKKRWQEEVKRWYTKLGRVEYILSFTDVKDRKEHLKEKREIIKMLKNLEVEAGD